MKILFLKRSQDKILILKVNVKGGKNPLTLPSLEFRCILFSSLKNFLINASFAEKKSQMCKECFADRVKMIYQVFFRENEKKDQ